MNALNANSIADAPDIEVKEIDVPEWGGSVFVKELTCTDANAFTKMVKGGGEDGTTEFDIESVCKTVALTMCDEDGKLVFPNAANGVKVLLAKNNTVVQRIFFAALKLAKLQKDDEEESAGND